MVETLSLECVTTDADTTAKAFFKNSGLLGYDSVPIGK